jgi:hypothetical protein
MTDDRAPFREAREHGLRQRHEQRLARARTVDGQFDDKAQVEAGRGTVYLKVVGDHYESTIALSPDNARELAALLTSTAVEATP